LSIFAFELLKHSFYIFFIFKKDNNFKNIDKTKEFEQFSQFIKSCFNSLTTKKPLKRKMESDDDNDKLEEKKADISSIIKTSAEISKRSNKRKVSFDDSTFEKKLRI
jgi:hypothetical protein